MKSFTLIITICFLFLKISFCQQVKELPYKPLPKEFVKLGNLLEDIDQSDDVKSIKLSLNGLKKFNNPYIQFDLIMWELSFHYANLKDYEKCFEILKKGQEQGNFYFIRTGNRPFPEFAPELQKLEGFDAFMEENKKLRDKANETSMTEYMVMLPENYNKNKSYPLLIVIHGGIGSIPDLQYYFRSPKLNKEYIVAFFQGKRLRGNYSRSLTKGWQEDISEGYKQIIANYPVDKSKIIMGGPSAGGYNSSRLVLNNAIPAKGLLLPFSMIPDDIDSTAFIQAAEKDLKIALLYGEDDAGVKRVYPLILKLEKYGIETRFLIFPETGHEFPDNWPHHLDTSLDFLMKE